MFMQFASSLAKNHYPVVIQEGVDLDWVVTFLALVSGVCVCVCVCVCVLTVIPFACMCGKLSSCV